MAFLEFGIGNSFFFLLVMDQYTVVKIIGEGSFGRALLVQSKPDKVKWVMKEIRLPKVTFADILKLK